MDNFINALCALMKKVVRPIISSPELKAQVSFSDHLLSVVCLSDICLLDF
jgi:hypothetical protein